MTLDLMTARVFTSSSRLRRGRRCQLHRGRSRATDTTDIHAQVPARDTARTVTRDSVRSARPATLEGVRVTATREGPRAPIELPYAVTLTRPDSLAAVRRQGVDELLFAVPGVAPTAFSTPS